MIYEYSDTFLVDSLADSELLKYETDAIKFIDKLQIEDTDYKEQLVISRVYMLASAAQLENEGMKDKYNVYEKEYKRLLDEAILVAKEAKGVKTKDTVYSVKIGRS